MKPTKRTPYGDYYEREYEGQVIRIIVYPLEKHKSASDVHQVAVIGDHPNGKKWKLGMTATKEFMQKVDSETVLNHFCDSWKKSLPK